MEVRRIWPRSIHLVASLPEPADSRSSAQNAQKHDSNRCSSVGSGTRLPMFLRARKTLAQIGLYCNGSGIVGQRTNGVADCAFHVCAHPISVSKVRIQLDRLIAIGQGT